MFLVRRADLTFFPCLFVFYNLTVIAYFKLYTAMRSTVVQTHGLLTMITITPQSH